MIKYRRIGNIHRMDTSSTGDFELQMTEDTIYNQTGQPEQINYTNQENQNLESGETQSAASLPLLNSLEQHTDASNNNTNNETLNKQKILNVIFHLSEEEIDRIEDHLREKLIENGERYVQDHDQLRSTHERLRIEYQQRLIELESEFVENQEKLSTESKNAHLYRLKSNENEEKLNTISKQLRQLENEKEMLQSDQNRLNTVNQNLESEKRDLFKQLDKRIKENDRLNEEWKSINLKLGQSESKICELTAKLEESQAKESTITFREKQFQTDKQRLLNEIDWLNQQLKEKSSQFLELKGSFNQKSYEQESKIEDLQAENKKYKSLMDNLQNANQSMETQIDELTQKLQEAREREVQTRIDFSEEAQSRERLIDLYQNENKSLKQKLEDAAQAIADLNQIVNEVFLI